MCCPENFHFQKELGRGPFRKVTNGGEPSRHLLPPAGAVTESFGSFLFSEWISPRYSSMKFTRLPFRSFANYKLPGI